jgi:hypothetical protein
MPFLVLEERKRMMCLVPREKKSMLLPSSLKGISYLMPREREIVLLLSSLKRIQLS